MAAVEGESTCDRDEKEDEANSTASDESFIVLDDIFDWNLFTLRCSLFMFTFY